MKEKDVIKNINEIAEILDEMKCHWWLEAGTCLGLYRDNEFIPWDKDIDFGILAENISSKEELLYLFGRALEKDFRIYHTFGYLENGFEVAFFKRGIKVDIFWFYKDKDIRWHSAWKNGGRNGLKDQLKYEYPAEIIENRKEFKFKGHKFYLPKETIKYLKTKYGEDWETPKKRWNWATSPKNLKRNEIKDRY